MLHKYLIMRIKYFFDKVFRYCVNELEAHKIGVAAVLFGISVFLVLYLFLKPYFFPNFMETNFETDEERGRHMIEQITR
jgi:transposase